MVEEVEHRMRMGKLRSKSVRYFIQCVRPLGLSRFRCGIADTARLGASNAPRARLHDYSSAY